MPTYSLAKAAEIIGTSRNTLSAWISRGAPAVEKADRSSGKEWQLSIPAIFAWRVRTAIADALASFHGEAGQITKEEADRRKSVAQARMAEVDLDERLRAVVLVADASENMSDFAQALRSGLDNVAVKCAGRASLMTSPHEIRVLIGDEINRAMRVAQQLLNEKWAETCRGEPPDDDAGAEADIGEEQFETDE